MTAHPVRLTDILTNAAAIADYAGAPAVEPAHLIEAIDHLAAGNAWHLADDATARSPLGRRGPRAAVPGAIRELALRWFERCGSDPLAQLTAGELAELREEIQGLRL